MQIKLVQIKVFRSCTIQPISILKLLFFKIMGLVSRRSIQSKQLLYLNMVFILLLIMLLLHKMMNKKMRINLIKRKENLKEMMMNTLHKVQTQRLHKKNNKKEKAKIFKKGAINNLLEKRNSRFKIFQKQNILVLHKKLQEVLKLSTILKTNRLLMK